MIRRGEIALTLFFPLVFKWREEGIGGTYNVGATEIKHPFALPSKI